jgi:hypothetical protein
LRMEEYCLRTEGYCFWMRDQRLLQSHHKKKPCLLG